MKGNKKYQVHPSNSPKCYENKLPVRRRSKQSGDLIGNKMDAGTRQQQQTAMSFPVNFLDKFFVAGQRRACPPVEKGGGYPDTAATKPVHSS